MLLVTCARRNGRKACHPVSNWAVKADFQTHGLHPNKTDKLTQKVAASLGQLMAPYSEINLEEPFAFGALSLLSSSSGVLGSRTALRDMAMVENIFTEPRT